MRRILRFIFGIKENPPQQAAYQPTLPAVQLTAGQREQIEGRVPQARQAITPPIPQKPAEQHECAICGKMFPTADDLSKHFPDHKELFDTIDKTGKGEMRDLGETVRFEDYLSFQHTEATASDLETLILTEAGIRLWGRRKDFTGMKWVGVIIAGALGLVIVLYIIMELMPGLFG